MNHRTPTILLLISLLLPPTFRQAYGQTVSVAFYNVESLCDTIPSPLIADSEFTPEGGRRWNSERYRTKIGRIAQVIDDLDADLIGLAEVENEAVVRDLMFAMKSDYNYIHRNTSDFRGMDLVLLYRGGRFFPRSVRQWGGPGVSREFLIVEGEIEGETVTLVVCHMPSLLGNTARRTEAARSLRRLIGALSETAPGKKFIVMGDFNASVRSGLVRREMGIAPLIATDSTGNKRPGNFARQEKSRKSGTSQANNRKSGTRSAPTPLLYTPFGDLEQQGFGTYIYKDRRYIYDFIALSPAFLDGSGLGYGGEATIFVRGYLLHTEGSRKGYPLRSFDRGTYTAGYSDHLPVRIRLVKRPAPHKPTND